MISRKVDTGKFVLTGGTLYPVAKPKRAQNFCDEFTRLLIKQVNESEILWVSGPSIAIKYSIAEQHC